MPKLFFDAELNYSLLENKCFYINIFEQNGLITGACCALDVVVKK